MAQQYVTSTVLEGLDAGSGYERVTSAVLEALSSGSGSERVTSTVAEVADAGSGFLRSTSTVLEVLTALTSYPVGGIPLPFFGGEMSSVIPANAIVTEDTTAGCFDATYSRCALLTRGPYGTASSPVWASESNFWFHCVIAVGWNYPDTITGPFLLMYSGSTVVAQVIITTGIYSCTIQLQTLQAGVMTSVGSAQTITPSNFGPFYRYTLDMQVTPGASGLASFFINGAVVGTASGLNHSAWTGITQVVLSGVIDGFTNTMTQLWWSQIIADNSNTIGRFLLTDQPTNESAVNTGWTGAGGASKLADINGTPWANDTTYIQSTTTGQTDTFYQSGLSLTGYYILGRGVAARVRANDGASVIRTHLVLRDAGTNYVSPTYSLSLGFTPVMYMWTADPATGDIWTPTAAAAVEFGVQSQN